MCHPEPSETKEQTKLQLPIWETNVDEYETKYHTKLDTMSEVTALKMFINPKVTGDKFNGLEYEQDETG